MSNKIKTVFELKDILQSQHHDKTIGLIAGCFDILHIGHINLFREAKKRVDILVIELENDENIRVLKGNDRPIHSVMHRADVLAELHSIDYLFIVDQTFTTDSEQAAQYYRNLVQEINPHYVFTSRKSDKYKDHKKESAQAQGIELIEIEPIQLTSTTEILTKLHNHD